MTLLSRRSLINFLLLSLNLLGLKAGATADQVYGKWAHSVQIEGMTIKVEFNFTPDKTTETVTCTMGDVTGSVTASVPSVVTDAKIEINGTDEEVTALSNGLKCRVSLSPIDYGYKVTSTTLSLATVAQSYDFQREN